MKDYLFGLGIISGLSSLHFLKFVIRKTLTNDYIIYGTLLLISLISSIIYLKFKKREISDPKEYFFIPLRFLLSISSIIVFLFFWINLAYKSNKTFAVNVSIKSWYIAEEVQGNKFSRKVIYKSAFVIEYNGNLKNVVLDTKIDDKAMATFNTLTIDVSSGFFGIDVYNQVTRLYRIN